MGYKEIACKMIYAEKTTSDVAKILGICYQTAYHKVHFKRPFTLEEVQILCKPLKIKPTEIFDVFLEK